MSLLPQPTGSGAAVVLRTWPSGETSVIASLLTADHGPLRVIAKGARRPHSALRPLVQPGFLVEVEYGLTPGRQLQYLRGGTVVLDPLATAPTLERHAFLLAAVELADRCPLTAARGGELYELCHDYVRVLSCAAPGQEALLFYGFELSLLRLQGLCPQVEACTVCGRVVAIREPGTWFVPGGGGLVCGDCRRQEGAAEDPSGLATAGRALPREVRGLLRRLASAPPAADPDDSPPARWAVRELGILLHRFQEYHLPGYRLPAALGLLRPAQAAGPPSATRKECEA
jgi:DNA repair protein RecO (recombination protein O)